MVGSVRELLQIKTVEQLEAAFIEFESELEVELRPLEDALDSNIISTDRTGENMHAGYIEAWRDRVTRMLYLAMGFVEHAKGSDFLLPARPGITDAVREAFRKKLSGPWVALAKRLELLISSIDSRVNLVKKGLDTESRGEVKKFAA